MTGPCDLAGQQSDAHKIVRQSTPTVNDIDAVRKLYVEGIEVGRAFAKTWGGFAVLTWYSDGKVTAGAWNAPTVYTDGWFPGWDGVPYDFLFSATGSWYLPEDIIGVATASTGDVWAWYTTGFVSAGGGPVWQDPNSKTLADYPDGYGPLDVVGIAMHPVTDRVYTYFANGRYCIGTPTKLCEYVWLPNPILFTPTPGYDAADIRAVSFTPAPYNWLVVWYVDGGVAVTVYPDDFAYAWYFPPW